MTNQQKYTLVQDNDCHWYIIPVEKNKEWDEWLEIDSDDERGWTPPFFSVSIDGPSHVVFEKPACSQDGSPLIS